MKLLTFNGSLKQKENKQSVSTRKEKKAKNIFPHVRTQFNSGSILNCKNKAKQTCHSKDKSFN
jgi:hypothetical protein